MRKKKATARRVQDTDIAIGERIRAVRNRAGISQEQLGDELQVSFQQIQKYEKGANRVSSGRLLQIAAALGCNVIDLLGGMEKGAPKITAASSFAASREGIAIINAMSKIENVDLRRQVIRLAEILAA